VREIYIEREIGSEGEGIQDAPKLPSFNQLSEGVPGDAARPLPCRTTKMRVIPQRFIDVMIFPTRHQQREIKNIGISHIDIQPLPSSLSAASIAPPEMTDNHP